MRHVSPARHILPRLRSSRRGARLHERLPFGEVVPHLVIDRSADGAPRRVLLGPQRLAAGELLLAVLHHRLDARELFLEVGAQRAALVLQIVGQTYRVEILRPALWRDRAASEAARGPRPCGPSAPTDSACRPLTDGVANDGSIHNLPNETRKAMRRITARLATGRVCVFNRVASGADEEQVLDYIESAAGLASTGQIEFG